jgi:hypothetical protein
MKMKKTKEIGLISEVVSRFKSMYQKGGNKIADIAGDGKMLYIDEYKSYIEMGATHGNGLTR